MANWQPREQVENEESDGKQTVLEQDGEQMKKNVEETEEEG